MTFYAHRFGHFQQNERLMTVYEKAIELRPGGPNRKS